MYKSWLVAAVAVAITGLTIRNLQCKDKNLDKYAIVRNNM